MVAIPLTQVPMGYDGHPQRMEVQPFSRDIHEQPGVYLQRVEGCGYSVTELTADEAMSLGAALTKAAQETMREFGSKM